MLTFQERILQLMRFAFYALFIATPFAMTNVNHELFEFNKMWLVFAISIVIFFLWGLRMISEKRFFIRRTILDIPMLLFLLSQIISTLISLDPHTSFWGYYSRFNGGLLSTVTYIFLYYALVSNFFENKESAKSFAKRLLSVSIIAGSLVALWGIPSHFGYDPTCLVFGRGLSTSCWTEAFNPTVRIFSTLGQPNWLAAYLAVLLPISVAFFIKRTLPKNSFKINELFSDKANLFTLLCLVFSIIGYIAIIWTNSQSGFIGLWAGLLTFIGIIKLTAFRKNGFKIQKFLQLKSLRVILIFVIIFLVTNFLVGNPFPRFEKISLPGLMQKAAQQNAPVNTTAAEQQGPSLEYNITGSGEIRLIVWKGALGIFKSSPLIGSGVETFAYAYYKHRPVEHNLTSEWDYLYNKAHNEYLNYLATTGFLGLGTYLFMIGFFLFTALRFFYSQKTISGVLIPAGIIGGYITILASNFFGFSVVLLNLYLIILPGIFLMLTGMRQKEIVFSNKSKESYKLSDFNSVQFVILTVIGIISLYLIWFLINSWSADKSYALGYNYNKIEQYIAANKPLEDAVKKRPGEDLYKNELSTNLASIALAFAQDNQAENAAYYGQRAKEMSDEVIKNNPNNVVYYKTRTRTLFTLAQMQPELLNEAYQTILKAEQLAPTDAKILYNKALIEEVVEKPEEALSTLEKTIKLKPNYLDAYYRQAIILLSLSESKKDTAEAKKYSEMAKEKLIFITTKLAPDFTPAQELLKTLE